MLINQIFCNIFLALLDLKIGDIDKYSYDIASLPDSKFTYIWQIVFCMFIDDFFFYFLHRLFHNKLIYKYFHKIHHEHYNTTCFSTSFTHPIDYLITNAIPVVLSFKILGNTMHFSTYLFWYFFVFFCF